MKLYEITHWSNKDGNVTTYRANKKSAKRYVNTELKKFEHVIVRKVQFHTTQRAILDLLNHKICAEAMEVEELTRRARGWSDGHSVD